MIFSPNDYYLQNLAALRARQSDVAELVDAVAIPYGVAPATGRDASQTFLVPTTDRRPKWFGQSSMPRVSAEEMFCNVRADGGSVTLPGILTGAEVLAIAGRLGPRHAVFVIEESLLSLKLAMHLYDYAELLNGGRLVFVIGDDIATRLSSFFTNHPGYELPGNMYRVAQRTAGQIAELQHRIEQAGAEVIRVQTDIVAACLRTLSARSYLPLSDAPRVAVLGVDGQPAALASGERALRGFQYLGWSTETCIPDRPDRKHLAGRLAAVERGVAGLVWYVGGAAAGERGRLPLELPVVNCYLPELSPPKSCPPQPGPFDLFLAGSQKRFDELLQASFPRDQIKLFEPAADVDPQQAPRAEELLLSRENSSDSIDIGRIAVMMDLPDDRAEVRGITLPSHVALWHALQYRVLCDADGYDDAEAESVLAQAEKASGTILTEQGLRDQFAAMLQAVVAPAAVARSIAQTLVKRGVRIGLWGANWAAMGRGEDVRRGAMPVGAALRTVAREGGLIVLPWFSHTAVQSAIDAMAAGAVVALRGREAEFVREYPGLAGIASYVRFFRTSAELVDIVGRVETERGQFEEASRDARRLVLEEHTVAARLRKLGTVTNFH